MTTQQGNTYRVSAYIGHKGMYSAPSYAVITRYDGIYGLQVVSEFTTTKAVSCAILPDQGCYFGSFDAAYCAYCELSEVYDIELRVDKTAERRLIPRIIHKDDVIESVVMDVNGTTNQLVSGLDLIDVVSINRSLNLPLDTGLGNFAGFLTHLSIKDILGNASLSIRV